jgi:hypothetical protein
MGFKGDFRQTGGPPANRRLIKGGYRDPIQSPSSSPVRRRGRSDRARSAFADLGPKLAAIRPATIWHKMLSAYYLNGFSTRQVASSSVMD